MLVHRILSWSCGAGALHHNDGCEVKLLRPIWPLLIPVILTALPIVPVIILTAF
jgi:hypothetical protein